MGMARGMGEKGAAAPSADLKAVQIQRFILTKIEHLKVKKFQV
jgi:hypothetical protein